MYIFLYKYIFFLTVTSINIIRERQNLNSMFRREVDSKRKFA